MKIILVRHGETIENQKGILAGQTDGKLTKKGIEQAKKLALTLKNEKIDAIYSSDLARAVNTAKEIAKYHKEIPLFFVKELREKDQGSFTGKKINEVDWNNKPADMETKEMMKKRAKRILEIAYKNYPKGNVIFVGHEGINRKIIQIIAEESKIKLPEKIEFYNASITILEIKKDKNHKIHLLNSVEHLK